MWAVTVNKAEYEMEIHGSTEKRIHAENCVKLQLFSSFEVSCTSSSMVSNQQDHDPPSRPERHSSPQSPSTATHHEPPLWSWSNARTRCQRDTGSATTTTISPHNAESATLDPPPRPPVRDQQTAIHGAATEALDLRDTCCGILDKL
ncbi:unnamed protein product [Pleuronectes platessa]|uniref:Uncharacterized protein n=1 Tax=Pleuronectes platessa TaxID=8262 RepID=A0A9N7VD76_PLEPL|nr:unnamed protein product [Pleuronectes platessa]